MRYFLWYYGYGVIGEGNFIYFDVLVWFKIEWKIWWFFLYKSICCYWFININYNGYDKLICYVCVYLCFLKCCDCWVIKIMK